MRIRWSSWLVALAGALLVGGAALPPAGAQAADTEVPVLQTVTRLNPATEQGPTTLRIQYTATDASSDVTATALVIDPRGNYLHDETTGKTGVLEFPLGERATAGRYRLDVLALQDGADPSNGAWYMATGQVAHMQAGSTGPTSHDLDFDALAFQLTQPGPPPWITIALRPLTLGQPTVVHDINSERVSVGSSGGPMGTPVRWDVAGAPTNLPVPAGCSGAATTIAENGVIAGELTCSEAPQDRQMIWFPNGTTLGSTSAAEVTAEDVEPHGIVVGSRDVDGGTHAAALLTDRSVQDLEDSTAASSVARAITSFGYVVGHVAGLPGTGNAGRIAVGWFGPYVFPLFDLAVPTSAVDVNELGYALVQIEADGATRGAIVGRTSTLLLDDGGDADEVLDLNRHGTVLGIRTVGGERHGVWYVGPSTVVRLDSIVTSEERATWSYDAPVAMNDQGWVVGNDDGTAWLLQPPPF